MMLRALALSIAVLAASALPAAAAPCGERDGMLAHLAAEYGESVVVRALVQGNDGTTALLEATASDDGSWTVLITPPDGPTCAVASGTDWQPVEPTADGPEL